MAHNQLTTSDIARTMQYHWQDQPVAVQKSWCKHLYKLRVNTDCDSLFLAVKWGVDERFVASWIAAGRALANHDMILWRRYRAVMATESWEHLGEHWDIHHHRCQCRITGTRTLTADQF